MNRAVGVGRPADIDVGQHILARIVGHRGLVAGGKADEPGAGRDDRERPVRQLRVAAGGVQRGVAVMQPAWTRQPRGRPSSSASAGRIGPSTSPALRNGPSRSAQPRETASSEKRWSCGRHKSVWQPRLVTSLARSPLSTQAQYCGQSSTSPRGARCRDRGAPASSSWTPRLSPPARRGESVAANGSRIAVIGASDLARGVGLIVERATAVSPDPSIHRRRHGPPARWRRSPPALPPRPARASARRRCLADPAGADARRRPR